MFAVVADIYIQFIVILCGVHYFAIDLVVTILI